MLYILYLHYETDSAWKVSEDGKSADAVWLPKSQCEEVKRDAGDLGELDLVQLEIPDWLARAKGFV